MNTVQMQLSLRQSTEIAVALTLIAVNYFPALNH